MGENPATGPKADTEKVKQAARRKDAGMSAGRLVEASNRNQPFQLIKCLHFCTCVQRKCAWIETLKLLRHTLAERFFLPASLN